MDGAYAHLWSDASTANIHPGPPMFANFVVANKIRQPHMHRTGFASPERSLAGVLVGNPSGMEKHPGAGRPEATDLRKLQSRRVAISHSFVINNHLTFTPVGIQISDFARKTFILRNEFQEVPTPVRDWGARTFLRSNRIFRVDDAGERQDAIPDVTTEREMESWEPPEYSLPDETSTDSAYRETLDELQRFVSVGPNAVHEDVASETRQAQCAANLTALFRRLRQYDEAHNGLPQAVLFPERPKSDPSSLTVLLGPEATDLLVCPSCGSSLKEFGLNYLWNEAASGQRLAELPNPAATWLMMDLAATHDWLVANHHAGHCGSINVLYADGRVVQGSPSILRDVVP